MIPLNDLHYVGLTLWGESRGEPFEGKLAVANVLKNRLDTGRWGTSYEAVCLAPKQFSCWNPNDPNFDKLQQWMTLLESDARIDDPVLRGCLWIAEGLIRGFFPTNVGKSTHYFSTSMPAPPIWSRPPAVHLATIGRHLFYGGVR